jgi:hypothetical protein
MKRSFIVLLLGFFAITANCAEVNCTLLAQTAEQEGEIVPDTGSGRDISGKGRLQFYSAPEIQCKIDGLFVVPGDVLFAQMEHKGFTKVAFIGMRKTDKEDVIAWVPSKRLRKNGQGIVPGKFTGER